MKNLKLMYTALLATTFLPQTGFGSALVNINHSAHTIDVRAKMVYSGEAATDEVARAATEEIQSMWNAPKAEVFLGSQFNQGIKYKKYRVQFKIDYVMEKDLKGNTNSCAYNFIRIKDKENAGDRSLYFDLGGRYGIFFTSDQLGTSTTAAHEFGHGLTLEHDDLYQLKAPVPGIMFARGSLVRPQFQWNRNARPGAAGGTINPKYRMVRVVDIEKIPFNALNYSHENTNGTVGCIGYGEALSID